MSDWRVPVVGVSVIVFRDATAREVLLVQRGREPLQGMWAPPGGKLELAETWAEAARREVQEETGLAIHVPDNAAFTVLDRIARDEEGALRYHYVLIEIVAWCADDRDPVAADDASDSRWWPVAALDEAQPQVEALPEIIALARQRLREARADA